MSPLHTELEAVSGSNNEMTPRRLTNITWGSRQPSPRWYWEVSPLHAELEAGSPNRACAALYLGGQKTHAEQIMCVNL